MQMLKLQKNLVGSRNRKRPVWMQNIEYREKSSDIYLKRYIRVRPERPGLNPDNDDELSKGAKREVIWLDLCVESVTLVARWRVD